MGAIKTSKLDNGNIGLEITYGGKEASFGGIDYSTPSPYIDPNCFSDASGFFVIDEQLVSAGWFRFNITLYSWGSNIYLDSGHFYQNGNYYNWTLGYTSTTTPEAGGVAAYTDVHYVIWVWRGDFRGGVNPTTTLSVRQSAIPVGGSSSQAAVEIVGPPATGTVPANQSASMWIGFNNDPTHQAGSWVYPGDTPAVIAAHLTSFLNTDPPTNSIATFAVDPGNPARIIITPLVSGTAGNSPTLTVQAWVQLVPANAGTSPVPVVVQQFSGGTDPYILPYGIAPNPVSWTSVGETLYIGGYGTMILQYTQKTGIPQLSICTSYLGAITLGKFNSQLIAAGIVPGPGLGSVDSPEMIIAWSAPNQLAVWNAVRGDGTVTGAGFNEITDISDYLTGIFINPGMAIILRTQGIDYLTPLSGTATPFDFAHISNALLGEGCQVAKFATQYDQVGVFIGNTNVYEFTGSLVPIGQKVKNRIFARPVGAYRNQDSASGPFYFSYTSTAFADFVVDDTIFTYNFTNKSWMPFYLTPAGLNVYDIEWLRTAAIPDGMIQDMVTSYPFLITVDAASTAPVFWINSACVQVSDFTHATPPFVSFPQEEIAFGRDITIEAAYISISGVPGQVVNFDVSGVLQASLTLPAGAVPNSFDNYQVFFSTSTQDKTTVQNPQLTISLPLNTSIVYNSFKIAKIALFGSFDPNQRPV